MTAPDSIDPTGWLDDQLASASPDLLRNMVKTFADAVMSADADQLCNADYGTRSPERTNSRNGYRARDWDTRTGTVELAIPKLRHGSYFPDWLLQHRRRAEQALVTVVATSYLLGVSTRRVEKLAEQLDVKSLSKSQVSEMAGHLDAQVKAFRERPLDAGPYTFVAMDALTIKVREDGRIVNVHALIATGVNNDGHREILGLEVTSAEDGSIKFMANPSNKDREPPTEITEAIRWLTENTRPVGDIMQPRILLDVLHRLESKEDGTSAATSTARRKRMTLTNALDYAVDCEMLPANPLGMVKAAKSKKTKSVRAIDTRSVVNPIQGATLLRAVEETGETGRRLKAFFGCMLYAGLRPEEAVALNKTNMPGLPESGWGELLLDEATPEISGAWSDSGTPNETRGLKHRDADEVRTVPCAPELTELLNWHLNTFGTASDGRLFRAVRSEGRLGSSVYGRAWAKARAATFTPEVAATSLAKRPYDLRHACLSWWLAAGVDPGQVAAWAGNSLKVLLEVYAKVIDKSARRSIALIDAMFGRSEGA